MELEAVYFGANSWLIEIDGIKVIIDPWLKGDLIFKPGEWFLKGKLAYELPIPKNIDLILLTQGLEDHTHPETLKKFSRDIPIIASKSACQIVNKMRFKHITMLTPGEELIFKGLKVKATAGARVPLQENGYICSHKNGSFYIEPHGYLDKSITQEKVDVLITPIVDLGFPLIGDFIRGASIYKDLIKQFKPKYILASTTGGGVQFEGLLSNFIIEKKNINHNTSLQNRNEIIIIPETNFRYKLNKKNNKTH